MLEVIVMPITYKCNCNCIMCSIPGNQTKDLPIFFYDKIFDDCSLNRIKSINITGGEPFLRIDIESIVDIILTKCKSVKELIFSTNGTIGNCVIMIERLLQKYQLCKFIISVSLDAINDHADEIRGVKDIYLKQMDTIMQLKLLEKKNINFKVVSSMTITKKNYDDIITVFNWAKDHDILCDYIYATVNTAYINSIDKKELFVLNEEEKKKVVESLKLIYQDKLIASDKNYYEHLFEKLLNDKKSKKSCIYYEKRGVLIEVDGTVRVCGMNERSYLGNLLEESFTQIYNRELPEMNDICENCLTNSYNAYSTESQTKLISTLLHEVSKLRVNKCENDAINIKTTE